VGVMYAHAAPVRKSMVMATVMPTYCGGLLSSAEIGSDRWEVFVLQDFTVKFIHEHLYVFQAGGSHTTPYAHLIGHSQLTTIARIDTHTHRAEHVSMRRLTISLP